MAVLMVMLFHLEPYPVVSNLAARLVIRGFALGQWGVDLFFVLSGYLITRILLEAKGTDGYLRNFYARRVLRIFPLYYATILIMLLVVPALSGHTIQWGDIFTLSVYGQGIAMTFFPTDTTSLGHLWSLAVEEHFYLIWPFVVLLIPKHRLVFFLFLVAVVSFSARILLIANGYGVFYFTISRFDAIAAGALVAVVANADTRAATHPRLRRIAGLAILVLAVPSVLLYARFSGSASPLLQSVKYWLIDGTFALWLLFIVTSRSEDLVPSLLSTRWIRSVGKYSYAMYIFHPMLFGLVAALLPPDLFPVRFGLSFACTFVAAWLSWRLLEARALSLKRYFTYGQVPSGATRLHGLVAEEVVAAP